MKEKLSAFMDNELDELGERGVLAALAEDPALRSAWERYHLIRSALHEDLEIMVAPTVAQRVAENIRELPALTNVNGARRQTARFAGTFAIAASVAALAIFGWPWLQAPTTVTPPLAVQQPASVPVPAKLAVRDSGSRWITDHPEAENALNVYLVEHNEFAPASGIGGMMPYVRVVGHGNVK